VNRSDGERDNWTDEGNEFVPMKAILYDENLPMKMSLTLAHSTALNYPLSVFCAAFAPRV
jgi:hypothetical protein